MEHAQLSRVQAHIRAPRIFSPAEPSRFTKKELVAAVIVHQMDEGPRYALKIRGLLSDT
jgi:hypothetical protein